MSVPAQQTVSPQARGREFARQGRALWQELGSVKLAALELMNQHREIPSIQAYRYASGLSQDQAAARYNEVAAHQTTLGGTTINAWETWARGRGAGSPPTFSSLLILALAYGRGPLGVAEEELSPGDLVAEAYERLPAEDQLALKQHSAARRVAPTALPNRAPSQSLLSSGWADAGNMVGPDFALSVPTVEHGTPTVQVFSLPNPNPGQLVDVTWETFGLGIERLIRQIKNLGRRLEADICFGVNEAGLVMATFMASAQFGRCPIGYLKCIKTRDEIALDSASHYPPAGKTPTIVICDFEVKHADVAGFIARQVRERYPGAELYFAVFGAMTKGSNLEVADFNELTGARIMRDAGFAAVFIAATMSPPGIEPPLELR
jgi:transcriptional regulator with XRE-family HTH domain